MRHFAVFCGWGAVAWTVVSLVAWALVAVAGLADTALRSRKARKAQALAASLIPPAPPKGPPPPPPSTPPQRIEREAKRIRRRLSATPSRIVFAFGAEDDEEAVEHLLAYLREWSGMR